MAGLKILVTGANGFIGKAFLKALQKREDDIYALDVQSNNLPEGFASQNYYQQDISQQFTLDQDFDFVFHLAAYNITHVGAQDEDLYQRINVQGTKHLIESTKIRNLIFLSTVKVYEPEGKPMVEDSPLGPPNLYGRSKLEAEKICREHFKGEQLCIFRPANIVGPGQDEKAVIPVLFKKAMAGEPLEIFAPKETYLQLLYVDDVIQLFIRIVEMGGTDGVFNLYSSDKISLGDLAHEIVKICDSNSSIDFTSTDDALFSEMTSKKLKDTFDWSAQTNIIDILKNYHQHAALTHE